MLLSLLILCAAPPQDPLLTRQRTGLGGAFGIPTPKPLFPACANELKAPQLKQRRAGFPKLVPVGYLDTAQVTEILSRLFGHRPGVVIVELPDTKCLTIRADPRTTRDALDMLRHLNAIAGGYRGGFNSDAVTVQLDVRDVILAIVRSVNEEDNDIELQLVAER